MAEEKKWRESGTTMGITDALASFIFRAEIRRAKELIMEAILGD